MPASDMEREEEEAAATEAAAIGGKVSSESTPTADEAQRPLREAGEGESEGFEESEAALVEHASHGDLHAARRVLEDAPVGEDDPRAAPGGEADFEHSSELQEDLP